ncbi:MAG: hypothetical protein JWP01_1208 [Myxococcales bacterium]|nr:hypothetical protein [Myxococcales bacterium]
MKTILLLTTVGVLTSTAFAGTPKTTSKKPVIAAVKKTAEATETPIKFNFGESYGEGLLNKTRTSAEPTSADPTLEAKSLSNSQVSKVVHDRVEELEYCWLRLPASKRVASSAVLHLAIEATGSVVGVTIEGELPATVGKCITAAASKWQFPSADSGCEIEHGIAMGTKSDMVR